MDCIVWFYLALHNQADGQSDRGVIVQNGFRIHTVHNEVTGPVIRTKALLEIYGERGRIRGRIRWAGERLGE